MKTDAGWIAYKDGKRLGPPLPSKAEAEALLTKVLPTTVTGGTYGGKDSNNG